MNHSYYLVFSEYNGNYREEEEWAGKSSGKIIADGEFWVENEFI